MQGVPATAAPQFAAQQAAASSEVAAPVQQVATPSSEVAAPVQQAAAPSSEAATQAAAPAAQAAPAQQAAPAPQAAAPAAQAAPAPQAAAPVVPAASGVPVVSGGASVAALNEGILDNVEGIGQVGNYVTVDGSQFLYKSSNRRADYLDICVHYGKRFYQWVDESNPSAKVYHNSDEKIDDRYKLKFEIRWYEQGEDGEPVEYTMSLSTTSSIQFINYVKNLAKAGLGVGQVWTRMTISRHNRPNSSERYSRVDFEAFSLETGEPLGIKSAN
jgi:hypothetical protein